MAESVIIEIGVDDKGTPVLKNVTGELEKMENQTSRTGDSAKKLGADGDVATGSMGKMGPAAVAAGAAVAGIAIAAASAGVAIVALYRGIDASVEAFKEQDEVNRALERSLRRTGFAGAPLREELEAIGAAIGQVAVDTMFGDEELSRMASTFVNLSGAATATEKDLRLIADIAAATGQSGEAAAKMYANALQGQLRPTLARTTALTEEQIEAINKTTDASDRAKLAQEALATAYGGTAEDLNPLTRASKNLEDAKGDLMQAIGQLVSEGGALEPFLEAVTGKFREVEHWIGENREAIQRWILEAVISAVESIGGLIQRLQSMSPVISLVIEYVQQVGRNFSIWVSAMNLVIRSAMAFQTAIRQGVVNVLLNVLDAGIKVADFLGRDVPEGVRNARASLEDIGEGLEEDMIRHLEAAGGSVDNIREKFEESLGVMDRITERSAGISSGLGMAGDMADRLRERLEESREMIGQVRDEPDRVGSGRDPDGDGESDGDRQKREAEEAEIERRNRLAQIRIAAFREEDERMKSILESEARRIEIEESGATEFEKRLSMLNEERSLAESLAAIDEEEHQKNLERIRTEEQARMDALNKEVAARQELLSANQALLGQLDQQISGLGTLAASAQTLSQISWDNAQAYEAMASAASGFASLGGQLASVIGKDRKEAAKIEAAFNAAAAVGSFAAFAATGFTAAPLGIAAAQHAIAAAQFAAVGGGGGAARTSPSRSAGASGSRTPREAQMIDSTRSQDSRPIIINNNLSGTFLEDANSVGRRIDGLISDSQRNRFVAGRGVEGRG